MKQLHTLILIFTSGIFVVLLFRKSLRPLKLSFKLDYKESDTVDYNFKKNSAEVVCADLIEKLHELISLSRGEEKIITLEKEAIDFLIGKRRILYDCDRLIKKKITIIKNNLLNGRNISTNILDKIEYLAARKIAKTKNHTKTQTNLCSNLTSNYYGTWNGSKLNVKGCNLDTQDPSNCLFGEHNMSRMTILGDSQGVRIFEAYKRSMFNVTNWVKLKHRERCSAGKFYNKNFKPNYQGQLFDDAGPVKYGQKHPGCTDCSFCDTVTYKAKYGNKRETILDFFAMEFAKDYELANDIFNTTQEYVIDYLSKEKHRTNYIYISFGAHDIVYTAKSNSTKHFVNNVYNLVNLIQSKLPKAKLCVVLFPKMFPKYLPLLRENDKKFTFQEKMNEGQLKVLQNLGVTCIVDGFKLTSNISTKKQREVIIPDGVHYPISFYDTVIAMINTQICPK